MKISTRGRYALRMMLDLAENQGDGVVALKDIAARGGIRCRCGSTRYGIQVHRDSVDLCCQDCGGKLRLPAATDEDLDRLCCQMTLTIPGRA